MKTCEEDWTTKQGVLGVFNGSKSKLLNLTTMQEENFHRRFSFTKKRSSDISYLNNPYYPVITGDFVSNE